MKESTVKYMARTWLIIWISWVFAFIGFEITAPYFIVHYPLTYLFVLLSFLGIELAGAFRKADTGDTLSELNWNAHRNAKGRRPFTTALVLSVALRGCTLPFILFGVVHPVLIYTPFLFMMFGFMITLAIHIWHSGKHG